MGDGTILKLENLIPILSSSLYTPTSVRLPDTRRYGSANPIQGRKYEKYEVENIYFSYVGLPIDQRYIKVFREMRCVIRKYSYLRPR